jgi:hypothetical protein
LDGVRKSGCLEMGFLWTARTVLIKVHAVSLNYRVVE